ncbi:GNAT family N-acetyltransferase [Mucilaginibacter sp. PAMB04274]|uniref:GNAT family N-acetyltransferase n=1 Tax=Mucilaginibacter sp. PAMB04274 TaxID=3138568 RepID=UPI0031F71E98
MAVVLETERLILRRFTMADAPFIVELLNSPGWLQYIGDRDIKTVAQAQSYLLNGPLLSYAAHGYGLYIVESKNGHQPMGMCGLLKREYLDHLDIGYALLPQYEGYGYAQEIVAATMQHAFTELKVEALAAITMVENTKSIRLLCKLGFVQNGTINAGGDKELLLFIRSAQTDK